MKKLITIAAITLSLLIPTNTLASTQTIHYYQSIMLATKSTYNQSTQVYTTTLRDENGNEWNMFTQDNIQGTWLNATMSDNVTPDNIYDDEIMDIGILSDTQTVLK